MKSAEFIVYLSYIYRVSIVYLSCIYRISIVYLSYIYRVCRLQSGCKGIVFSEFICLTGVGNQFVEGGMLID